jgi:hypothetical protein
MVVVGDTHAPKFETEFQLKIVSSFKDYYDGIASRDGDYKTVYVRGKTEIIRKNNIQIPITLPQNYTHGSDFHIIGFCGQLHLTYDFRCWNKQILNFNWSTYTRNMVERILQQCSKGWDEGFAQFGPQFKISFDVCGYNITRSPKLMGTGFESIVPPTEAYMLLYKYLCNQARPERKIPEMSNNIKIEQHGFDLKHSFRSSKGKGK